MITCSTDAASYVISPTQMIAVTITDTAASGTGWAIDWSFDAGATWIAITTVSTTGLHFIGPTAGLTGPTPASGIIIRATNRTTSATANAGAIAVVGDTITVTFVGQPNPTQIVVYYVYDSDGTSAHWTGGDVTTTQATTDDGSGPQANNDAFDDGSWTVACDFPATVDSGATFQMFDDGGLTWDRRGATISLPQSFLVP